MAAVPEGLLSALGFRPLSTERLSKIPGARRVVFLVGCETATTTIGSWLANLDEVEFTGTPSEIYAQGLTDVVGSYALALMPGPGKGAGLVSLFSMEELLAELRSMADVLLAEACGGAATVVDHGASLVRHLEVLRLIHPDAMVVHVDDDFVAVARMLRARRVRSAWRCARSAAVVAGAVRLAGEPNATVSLEAVRSEPYVELEPVLSYLGAEGRGPEVPPVRVVGLGASTRAASRLMLGIARALRRRPGQ